MEIVQPRRILIISPPSTTLSPVINSLVPPPSGLSRSSKPSDETQPVHHISTTYYSAKVPIWTDNIDNAEAWSQEWKDQNGAGEVVKAVGAWVVAFKKPATHDDMASIRSLLGAVASVLNHHTSDTFDTTAGDALQLAIALPQPISPALELSDAEWDDICRECGNWEFIDSSASGTPNDYGEKTGLTRLLEALQTGDWESAADAPSDSDFDDILDEADEDLEKGFDPAGAETEGETRDPILGSLKGEGVTEGDDDEDVETLQKMLLKMQAARDLGQDVPATERRRMAKQAVKEVMKDL